MLTDTSFPDCIDRPTYCELFSYVNDCNPLTVLSLATLLPYSYVPFRMEYYGDKEGGSHMMEPLGLTVVNPRFWYSLTKRRM
jgi:hypothetical protein